MHWSPNQSIILKLAQKYNKIIYTKSTLKCLVLIYLRGWLYIIDKTFVGSCIPARAICRNAPFTCVFWCTPDTVGVASPRPTIQQSSTPLWSKRQKYSLPIPWQNLQKYVSFTEKMLTKRLTHVAIHRPPPLTFRLTEQCFRTKNKHCIFKDYKVKVNIQIVFRVRPTPRIDSSRCHSS